MRRIPPRATANLNDALLTKKAQDFIDTTEVEDENGKKRPFGLDDIPSVGSLEGGFDLGMFDTNQWDQDSITGELGVRFRAKLAELLGDPHRYDLNYDGVYENPRKLLEACYNSTIATLVHHLEAAEHFIQKDGADGQAGGRYGTMTLSEVKELLSLSFHAGSGSNG